MTPSLPRPAEIGDEDLAVRFTAGDEAAFALIYDRYNTRVTTYALRMLGRREDAEDVCTEVFVRLVERRWRPVGTVRSYLFTLAHRLCVDRIRSRRRWHLVFGWFVGPEPEAGADDALSLDQDQRRLQQALGALSEDHRAVVALTYTEGLTSPEIAEILGCTDQQVRSKLAYARRLLREHVGVDHG
jgi:RNA polymerase sigma-70 factor, ECF subfamily